MYRKLACFIMALGSIALLGTTAKGTIVEIVCTDEHGPLPEDRWSFDYELQLLTITDLVHGIYQGRCIQVSGSTDSESRFTIVENVTNRTGVALTGYALLLDNSIITENVIVEGSVQATRFPEVHQTSSRRVEFVWPEAIPDRESFTIQFDVISRGMDPDRLLSLWLCRTAVPEPGTITLLGLCGLALLRTRRFIGSQRKA